ncbi:isoprenylcysteine carboxylmethyltransferase family protein [Aquabacterium sp. A08]|uniref:methyltransferase family protein n=1 Tax=Aquabacterium sp. A08 TaxID=2718532 RepID=UPI00142318B6|nr:isoprenylcysteine carboxylmethyltransferase family protein [Aquabacterium sp. A08]
MNPHRLGQLWVALQFGLLSGLTLLCLFRAPPQGPDWPAGLLWCGAAALGLWTLAVNPPGNFHIRPEPRPDGRLVCHGPYRWVRHPMYTAVLLLAAGAAAWLASGLAWGLWGALVAVLVAKARLEERWLLARYPAYAAYRQRTWRLFPGVF